MLKPKQYKYNRLVFNNKHMVKGKLYYGNVVDVLHLYNQIIIGGWGGEGVIQPDISLFVGRK